MPLTKKGAEIRQNLVAEYGEKRGTSILYAGKNSGTFTGIDSDDPIPAYIDSAARGDSDGMTKARDAMLRKR